MGCSAPARPLTFYLPLAPVLMARSPLRPASARRHWPRDAGRETLAEIIGTTRSHVSQFVNKFRRLGFIDYNGHLSIQSSLLSVVLHE
jgi:Crp-like helix-turn-helix protein